MNTLPSRRGFTLIELLVVVVLGSLLLMATYQLLVVNNRVYAVNDARVQGQQTLRAGMDVLFGELREVSTREGDLIDMGVNSLTIRAQRSFGLICGNQLFGRSSSNHHSESLVRPSKPETRSLSSMTMTRIWSSDDRWLGGVITGVDGTGPLARGVRLRL